MHTSRSTSTSSSKQQYSTTPQHQSISINMPPPPPPSKSYSIRIVDSDDEDSEAEQTTITQGTSNVPPSNDPNNASNSYRYTYASTSFDNVAPSPVDDDSQDVDDDDDDEESGVASTVTTTTTHGSPRSTIDYSQSTSSTTIDTETENCSTNNQKSKRRKRKKKKRKGANSGQSARRVHFGSVSVLQFGRCLGGDAVPSDGGWPLGMAMTISTVTDGTNTNSDDSNIEERVMEESIDDYETEKQARLHCRYKGLELDGGGGIESDSPAAWLETRQWDYRYKSKNPLFRMMTEKERMVLLLADSSTRSTEEGDGVGSLTAPSQDTMYTPTRTRSGSMDKDKSKTQVSRSRSASFAEQYNETYTQLEVHHVRNELETLRNCRSKEGNTGCTCRKLDVYLLPPGGGGKKAHSRRMNERKVKEELRKRHLLPPDPKTREELEILLHDTVEKEPCCLDDCACVRDGIECQADTCKCWFTSHQADKGKNHDDIPSIEKINSRCGNRFGMYTVDMVKIDDFRSSYLCVEIKS